MSHEQTISAKAVGLANRSDSIVVSFGKEWHQSLTARRFSLVIRKRVPKSSSFKWLYFYINSPIGAICARAQIERIFDLSSRDAIRLANDIDLSPQEISNYIGHCNHVGCYRLGTFEFCKEPITRAKLAEKLSYYPPQSFFIVDKNAKTIIDGLAGFSNLISSRGGLQLHV